MLTAVACSNETIEETDKKGDIEESAESKDNTETEPPVEEDVKSIDIYIVAGQSNAAGCTVIDCPKLEELWSDCRVGHEHVIYSGVPDYNWHGKEINWQPAKAGQGVSENHMGPEVGMAKLLHEEYYNESTGKVAGIIKFAHGGTSLMNLGGASADYGNWLTNHKDADDSELNGKLYRGLLTHFEKSVNALKEQGYEKITVKGVY